MSREEMTREQILGELARLQEQVGQLKAAEVERRQTEEKLSESEERFRRLSEAAFEAIAITENGRLVDANQAFAELYGYRLDEVEGMEVLDFVAPESRELVQRHLHSGYEKPYEAVNRRKDGSTFTALVSGRNMPYQGREARVTAIRDITPHQRETQALEQAVQRLNLLLDFIRNLTLDLDILLERVIRGLGEVLPAADIRVIYLYDASLDKLVPQACFGYDEDKLQQVRLEPGESMSGKVFQSGRSVLTSVPEEVERQAGALGARNARLYSQAIAGKIIYSNICTPLRTGPGEIIGTITVSSTHSALAREDLALLEGVAGQVGQAIANAQLFKTLQEREVQYRQLAENLPVGISETSPEGEILYMNSAARAIMGYRPEELAVIRAEDLYADPDDRRLLVEGLQQWGFHSYEHRMRHKDGHIVWIRGTSRAVKDEEGQVVRYQGMQEDITEARNLEKRQNAIQEVREEVWNMSEEADIEKVLVAVRRALEMLEIPFQACGINLVDEAGELPTVHFHSMAEDGEWLRNDPDTEDTGVEIVLQFWRAGAPVYRRDIEAEDVYGERAIILRIFDAPVRSVIDVPFSHGTLAFNSPEAEAFSERDIAIMQDLAEVLSEGFRRQEDLKALNLKEEQLRQSQKMEAIGHLAGGIAHDFNNLITVINGYSEFLIADFEEGERKRRDAEEIHKAGKRASALVSQLLAFSRRQILQPGVVDLNEIIDNMEKMLRRLISEDIDLFTLTEPVLGRVYADRGQLEQVVVNLAINARDAMPGGGRLEIRTQNAELGAAHVERYVDAQAGPHVALEVRDTGSGMDEETQARIFEPFFTTKSLGKGTGLGLATVYGIVKQSQGHITVDSALGRGTVFKVYLPRVEPTDGAADKEGAAPASPRGQETILLVEDEELVRKLARRILVESGYSVLEAAGGPAALQVAGQCQGPIDLLLTDVVMPGMDGRELAEQLTQRHPALKVVYMSAYMDRSIEDHGILVQEAHFIQKPFNQLSLTSAVRAALDES